MLTAGGYVDVEQLLIGWLADVTELRVVAELPVDITEPTVQINTISGGEVNPALDRASIDVDVFVPPDSDGEPDLETAQDIAAWIRWLVLQNLPGHTATIGHARATVIRTAGLSRPVRRPFDESGIRRINLSFSLLVATRG